LTSDDWDFVRAVVAKSLSLHRRLAANTTLDPVSRAKWAESTHLAEAVSARLAAGA
jgi:hypothetical protein